jgi:hypothetical protein
MVRPNQKYLCIKGSGGGGLGDSIRALLSGILYARLTNRLMFVDWSHGVFDTDRRNAFVRLFQLRDIGIADELPVTESVHPPRWRGQLNKSLDELYREDGCHSWKRADAIDRYSFDQTRLDYPERVLVMWDFDQFGAMAKRFSQDLDGMGDAQALQACLLRQHLALAPELRCPVDSYAETHFRRLTIGVHVRLTEEAAAQRPLIKIQQYFDAIDPFLRQHDDAAVFLATDNANVVKQFRRRYAHLLVREKWFARVGDALHLNEDCPDLWRSTLDAAVELFLLARCDYLVTASNSSFSIVAGLASQAARQHKITLQPSAPIWKRIRYALRHAVDRG